ncbi:MAG: lipid II:glycine glycyltransferase FemX [Bryobacteraceae bacterium]
MSFLSVLTISRPPATAGRGPGRGPHFFAVRAVPAAPKETQIFDKIHPLTDPRWNPLVERHPNSSVFHTSTWLTALHRTYGYQPVVYTSCATGADLPDGVPFCVVDSWLTGRRLVSLPFSDHCDPLLASREQLPELHATLKRDLQNDNHRYFELRTLESIGGDASLSQSTYPYLLHLLDLTPDIETLFRNCHRDSTQRKIRRAEREGLDYEEGRSESLLNSFYRLLILTRQRHRAPPQPKLWFQNLIDCFGDDLKIRVASLRGRPVASILTLRHKDTLVYKYGCSDARFNTLGGTHLLFWRSIQESKREGLRILDLGRSEIGQTGLITFKNRWGGASSPLTYSRFTTSARSFADYTPASRWKMQVAKGILSRVPSWILTSLSRTLFRHIG